MPFKSFENLKAWQYSREFTRDIYMITKLGEFAKDFGLCNQIQRAAVSIASNIAEGHERGSRAEFNRFLLIAKGSCAEIRAQLYLALDIGYIDQKTFNDLFEKSDHISRLIGALRRSIK